MKGAPVIAIQKLAGHKGMQTTMRYMHLAEGEAQRAIRLLEAGVGAAVLGDMLETTAETAVTS